MSMIIQYLTMRSRTFQDSGAERSEKNLAPLYLLFMCVQKRKNTCILISNPAI